ncbi:MAG: tetratricopeptide repeat protein [Acidobacteriota bacterium]
MRSLFTPLLRIFYNPAQAMTALRDGSHYLAGAVFAIIASVAYFLALNRAPRRAVFELALYPQMDLSLIIGASVSPILFLAVVYIPACLLAANLIERRSSFSVLLRQEYAPMASCILYSWAASHLIMLVPALVLFDPAGFQQASVAARMMVIRIAPLPYFIFLAVIALRVVLRLKYGQAIGAILLSSFSLIALPLVAKLPFLLSSPFLAFIVIILIMNFLGSAMSSARDRENFKQSLEAATLNPADASAHYNLGLIYQQRGDNERARASFLRAIEIDADETDAHYQLGRIAREEGKLADAILHFDAVLERDPDHSQSEIWREVGRAYFQAAQYEDALTALERFLDKRHSDAEGLYLYGLTLYHLGREEEAAREMRACVEAVRTAPAYKYRSEKRWLNEAQAFLRERKAEVRNKSTF